jgi:hypothetical protein
MSPLIKPLNHKKIEQREVKSLLLSLRKTTKNPSPYHYPFTERECLENIKDKGRLLIFPLLSREESLKRNKKIHQGLCDGISWARCDCPFSKHIRALDLNLDPFDKRIRKVI